MKENDFFLPPKKKNGDVLTSSLKKCSFYN